MPTTDEPLEYIEWPENFDHTLAPTLEVLKMQGSVRDWSIQRLTSDGEVHLVIFYN